MRTFCALAALAALALLPPGSAAQPAVGHVGTYSDPQGIQPAIAASPFAARHAYVVVVVADDLSGFDLSVETSPEILVMAATAYDAPSLCIQGCGPEDWSLVGLQCLPGSQTQALVDVQWMLLAVSTDRTICVRPLNLDGPLGPSGPVSLRRATLPAYRDCANESHELELAVSPYGPSFDGCALINPTVVAAPAMTWSHVKGTFSN